MSKHTSIELSKRLKELGLDDGTSEEVWAKLVTGGIEVLKRVAVRGHNTIIAPAYQFHEVAKKLSRIIERDNKSYRPTIDIFPDNILACYCDVIYTEVIKDSIFEHESPVEAIALLWEYTVSRRGDEKSQ